MNYIQFINSHKSLWDKKTVLTIDGKKTKIVGIGFKSLKTLWYGEVPGSTVHDWNQSWIKYKNLTTDGKKAIRFMVKEMEKKLEKDKSQQTLF